MVRDGLSYTDMDWTCNGLVPITYMSLCHLSFESQGAYAVELRELRGITVGITVTELR
jgi:hypothetical protein